MVALGGTDVEFLSTYSIEESLHHACSAVLSIWPDGVIEDSDTSSEIGVKELLGSRLSEVFVFRDSWGEFGWTPENCRKMVHVLSHHDGVVTCVVEDRDLELGRILAAVELVLTGGPRTVRRSR